MTKSSQDGETPPVWWEAVRRDVSALRFGQVLITVHEGRVVQIDKTEKIRFETAVQSRVKGKPADGSC